MKKSSLLGIFAALLPCVVEPAFAQKPQQQEVKVRALAFQPEFPFELHAHEPSGAATAGLLEIRSFLNDESNLLKFKGGSLVFTRRVNPISATDVNETVGKVDVP